MNSLLQWVRCMRPNGVGAYATGSLVHFVVDGQLSDYGVAVSSREILP